ncbi:DUF1127 domain-containing protein [Phyllobacterium sp. LjRoot231]|uniref:DUF1127 domain-containing protein n=1 Tax=Phyllobacterium sp. LjRoot231 TaxID=3342289 RepID=UPI003ECFDC32
MTHQELRSELRGKLFKPGNQAYDAVCVVWNSIAAKTWQAYISYRSHRAGRQHVNKLSDHLLADIGVTPQEAEELDRRKL